MGAHGERFPLRLGGGDSAGDEARDRSRSEDQREGNPRSNQAHEHLEAALNQHCHDKDIQKDYFSEKGRRRSPRADPAEEAEVDQRHTREDHRRGYGVDDERGSQPDGRDTDAHRSGTESPPHKPVQQDRYSSFP